MIYMANLDKQWWFGFDNRINFSVNNDLLTVYIYDPPDFSFTEIEGELNPHTEFGHELSHLLAGAFYFKGFDPSGAFIWKQKIDDSFDKGRALFYETWVIYGQSMTDINVDEKYKLEHFEKGRYFLQDTFQVLFNKDINSKWVERWDSLKNQIDLLTEHRKNLLIDPWFPSGFKRIRLGQLPHESFN
jgi:hypothetical protein